MIKKLIFLCLSCLCLLCLSVNAAEDAKKAKQLKTDMETAKTALKNATDMEANSDAAKKKRTALENSEQTMRKYLADSAYSNRKDIHLMLIELLRKQYEVGNNKMYLKQQIDTVCLIKTGRRMFLAIEALDSLDAMPNEKGIIAPSYRKKHSEFLAPYRGNIFNGGIYFVSHQQWDEAWQCFDLYLDTRRQPLFTAEKLDTTQDAQAAYLALLAAQKLTDLTRMRKYADEALQYQPRRERTLTMLSDMCFDKKDTVNYLKYISEGFKEFPKSEYFFPRLVDYYTARGDYNTSYKYVNEALKQDSTNQLFLLAKHGVLIYMEKYDDALYYAYKLLQYNDTLPVLNYNVGYIYYLKAQQAMKQTGMAYRQRMKNAQKFYKQSLTYMERYRKEVPNDRERWYPILYDAYLNLNMGKEFNELEK